MLTAKQKNEIPKGEWSPEPDFIMGTYRGYPWRILRYDTGHLCGYVGVPKGHPFYGKGYNELSESELITDPHGGFTYCEKRGPCDSFLKPKARSKNTWWIGFDCAHCFDILPGSPSVSYKASRYRNFNYLHKEVIDIIDGCIHAKEWTERSKKSTS